MRLVLLVLLAVLLFGFIIHIVEPEHFPTFFDGIWWAIVTISTVGYGDFSPVSDLGRTVGIFLILIGTGFMTLYFASLSASVVTRQNSYQEGMATFTDKNHVILVGWNERVRETITQLTGAKKEYPIVLIDESLSENPLPLKNVTFIKGNPSHDETLLRANITKAEMVIISADQSKNEVHADMATILALVTAKGLNPDLYTIVEILTKKQIINAKRAGADEVIETNTLSSFVMTNSILSHGVSETLLVMLNHLAGNKIEHIPVTEEDTTEEYIVILNKLFNQNILLLGIKRGDESFINPPPAFKISKNDELLVIRH